MKNLVTLIVFAIAVYYFVFSNNRVAPGEISNQIETEDRVLDYDIKYNKAVEEINEAVESNLEKHKSIEELLDDVNSGVEVDVSEERAKRLEAIKKIEESQPMPELDSVYADSEKDDSDPDNE